MQSTELHNAVVLHLAILNDGLAKKNQYLLSNPVRCSTNSAGNALACAPSDGFTWLTFLWLDADKRGLRPENLAYLRLSYEISPNEGWIAIWRNRLAMTIFDRLPPELANKALDEFVILLDTGRSYDERASIFERASPDVQQQIVQQLSAASPLLRQIFARVLYDRGLDITIPGTTIPGLRPCER